MGCAGQTRGEQPGLKVYPALASTLEACDLVPQCAELALVEGPNFRLRDFAELIDLGFHHGHALRLEQLLGTLKIVDRLGGVTHPALSLATQIEKQLVVLGRQVLEHFQVHDHERRAVIVEGHGAELLLPHRS